MRLRLLILIMIVAASPAAAQGANVPDTTRAWEPATPPMDWVYAAIDPPAEYQRWWGETEACLDSRRDFDSIMWLVVKGRTFSLNDGDEQYLGYSLIEGDKVMVAQGFRLSEWVIKHEAVHMITRLGDEAHHMAPFLECAPVGLKPAVRPERNRGASTPVRTARVLLAPDARFERPGVVAGRQGSGAAGQ